jgi:protocatechuate 3,4-dioxygenase beta subunit
LIADHAVAAPLTICGPQEPGTRLTLSLTFLQADGTPARNALLYIYHTSNKGWYSDKAAHIRANSGDDQHARLFGYARTDENGRVEVRTIRPAGYPRTTLPAHFHVALSRDGKRSAAGRYDFALYSEVRFLDDPRLTPEARAEGKQAGYRDVPVEKQTDGSERCSATFTLTAP